LIAGYGIVDGIFEIAVNVEHWKYYVRIKHCMGGSSRTGTETREYDRVLESYGHVHSSSRVKVRWRNVLDGRSDGIRDDRQAVAEDLALTVFQPHEDDCRSLEVNGWERALQRGEIVNSFSGDILKAADVEKATCTVDGITIDED